MFFFTLLQYSYNVIDMRKLTTPKTIEKDGFELFNSNGNVNGIYKAINEEIKRLSKKVIYWRYEQYKMHKILYKKFDLNEIDKDKFKKEFKAINQQLNGDYPRLRQLVQELLHLKLKNKFKCSEVLIRTHNQYLKKQLGFHLDYDSITDKSNGDHILSVDNNDNYKGLRFIDPFIHYSLDPHNSHKMINFWAILNESNDYPLAFGSLDILDPLSINSIVYYTSNMKIGEFYLFDSFAVPHSGIFMNNAINSDRISMEMRCVYVI